MADAAAGRARRFCARLLFAALFLGAAMGAGAAELVLHLSPKGSDSADGATAAQPLASLGRALAIARSRDTAGSDIVLRFGAGPYGAQALDLDWVPGDGRRLVLDGGPASAPAVFDGGSSNLTWLRIRGARGLQTKVTVRGFVVRGYRQGIQFFADWRDDEPWHSGNLIEGNSFENIGQFRAEVQPALAALHMLGTSDSTVRGNRFINIRNLAKCDGHHAIYIAGSSRRNRIEGNVFDGGCGDTIKVRNGANDNVIKGNSFSNQTGKAIFVDSFCDARKQPECKGKEQECPSWNNVFVDNTVDEVSARSVKAITRHVGAENIPACPRPVGARRIIDR